MKTQINTHNNVTKIDGTRKRKKTREYKENSEKNTENSFIGRTKSFFYFIFIFGAKSFAIPNFLVHYRNSCVFGHSGPSRLNSTGGAAENKRQNIHRARRSLHGSGPAQKQCRKYPEVRWRISAASPSLLPQQDHRTQTYPNSTLIPKLSDAREELFYVHRPSMKKISVHYELADDSRTRVLPLEQGNFVLYGSVSSKVTFYFTCAVCCLTPHKA